MTPEQEILQDQLARAETLAAKLVESRARIAPLLPLEGNPYDLSLEHGDLVWSFVKQFELFHDSVGRKLLRSVAVMHNVPLRTRDVSQLLEWSAGTGLIDLEPWRDLAKLRNMLAHEYIVPLSSFDVVIGDAWTSCDRLFDTHKEIVTFVARERLLETKDE